MSAISSLHGEKKAPLPSVRAGAHEKGVEGYRIAQVQGDNGKMVEYATKTASSGRTWNKRRFFS